MIIKCIVGFMLIAVSVVLMVWGYRYLGEEKGRNPQSPSKDEEDNSLTSPCSLCGSCQSDSQPKELSDSVDEKH